MPTVQGKQYPYTAAGKRAAAKARKSPAAAPTAPEPRMKSSMMGKGYNFTKNLGENDLPDIGY